MCTGVLSGCGFIHVLVPESPGVLAQKAEEIPPSHEVQHKMQAVGILRGSAESGSSGVK